MSLSAHIRRGLGLAAAAALAAGGLQIGFASTASAQEASIDNVRYTCTPENELIFIALGVQPFYVNASATLPDTVSPGETIPPTPSRLDLGLPASLVKTIREKMPTVERVAGTANSKVLLQGVNTSGEIVGELTPTVQGLKADGWVDLPASGGVLVPASGTVESVTVPDFPAGEDGLIYVQMPKTFVVNARMDPPYVNQGSAESPAVLNCVRDSDVPADRIIGTIPVGNGCTQAECPLTGDGSGGDPDPSDPGDGSNGGGNDNVSDPSVPSNPQDPNDPVDPDYTNDGNGSDDDDSGDVASYTTTSLPATGSPLGVSVIALLAAAVVGRVALGIRNRRRAKA